jgi:hypothetical protein
MNAIPAPTYALRLLADGKPIRGAADEAGLEVGQVVAALLDDWRKQRDGTPSGALTGPGWEQYLQHPSPKVTRAAERLRDVFAAEDAKTQLLLEKQRLEAQLARVKGQLRGSTAAAPAARREATQRCPDCDGTFANLGVHRARKHAAAA